uniref:T9SS type A sorting domain-containing protein n=1 Tax=Ignavibacterium album TaxID=591197 RepID=A0A832LJ42_9BACT
MFAGDGQYTQLYRSTDYGDNWVLSANLRPLVFATDSNNIVYAGTHYGLFATTDNGLTWAQNNFLSNIPVSSILIDSANNIYCGTGYYDNGNGVFYSTDGGNNWIQLGLEGKVVLSLAFDSQGNLYAGTKQDGLFKTTDFGQSWTQHKNGLYRKEVFRLKINQQDNIFIGSENEGVFRSTNNGNSFEQIGLPISRVKNIVFSGDSLIITSTPSGVQKYNRLTNMWTNIGLQNVEAVSITKSNYLFVATLDEGLFKSMDLGQTWQLTNLTKDTLMSVYNVLSINNDTLFALTEFNLRISFNGGQSWSIVPINTGFFSRGITANFNTIFVTGYGSTTDILYKSTNFGLSFDSVFSGFSLQPENNLIIAIENGFVFLGDSNIRGIMRSTNEGFSWEQVIFDKNIVSIFARTDGKIFAGSDSIYFSSDFGKTWTSFFQPIGNVNFVSDIKSLADKLYFGTYRTGLYEIEMITSVNYDENNLIKSYHLLQNYPNPFNPLTKIQFTIPKSEIVQIKVYDILGSEIKTLLNEYKQLGTYEVEFDAINLPSGVYFYRMISGSYTETKKMILLR